MLTRLGFEKAGELAIHEGVKAFLGDERGGEPSKKTIHLTDLAHWREKNYVVENMGKRTMLK